MKEITFTVDNCGIDLEKIKEAAQKAGMNEIIMCTDMEDAVNKAREIAKAGDVVMLSPACASWGMFDNYEQRGRIFKELVRKL